MFFAILCDDRESVARAIVREKSWQLSYLWIELTELRHTCIDVQVVEISIGLHKWENYPEKDEMMSKWYPFELFLILSHMANKREIISLITCEGCSIYDLGGGSEWSSNWPPPPPYIHFFGPQLTPYNILQNLTTNWVGVRLPPTYIFGDPLLTPTYIFNFIPTPPPDQKWNSPYRKFY